MTERLRDGALARRPGTAWRLLAIGLLLCLGTGARAADTILDRILARGELRVGTTGDYAPFSVSTTATPDGEPGFRGFDIEMARSLARSLDVELRLVATSWPTLMADLAADRFDIGMSGISRTLARARVAYFSTPYHQGGKTPIARCEDAGRFRDFESIDQVGVRVVVNPGGTNEAFVRSRLRHASLRVHPDNRTIFREIAEHRADVMFTDEIEVALQSARDDRLCPALPGTLLTHAEKAYLMPRDEALRQYVNLWLAQLAADEALAARLARTIRAMTAP